MSSKIYFLLRRTRGIVSAYNYMTARVTVENRYKYDFANEDGYHEKEMTRLEAKTIPLPMPSSFRHKRPPLDEMYPAHWNDVRFNHHPAFFGRRCFIHDTYFSSYDFEHDIPHALGFQDEDFDYELPDPLSAMHFKKKRSPILLVII